MLKINFRFWTIVIATLTAVAGITSEIKVILTSSQFLTRNIFLLIFFKF